jgi:dsRNA-specific ribonuclease
VTSTSDPRNLNPHPTSAGGWVCLLRTCPVDACPDPPFLCQRESQLAEDNERLEFLGDAVLDFIVGAWVYHRFPEMPEGDLTKMRSAIVRNDQLARFARSIQPGGALRLGRGELSTGGNERDGLLGLCFRGI